MAARGKERKVRKPYAFRVLTTHFMRVFLCPPSPQYLLFAFVSVAVNETFVAFVLYETFSDDKSSITLYFKPLMFQCLFVTVQTRKHEDRLIAVIDRLTTRK